MRAVLATLLAVIAALGGGLARAQDDELEDTEQVHADTSEQSEPAQDATAAPAETDSGLTAQLAVGAGLTQRSLTVPSNEGTRTLDPGLTPALHLGLSGRYRSERRNIGLHLTYQSSAHARTRDAVGDGSLVPSEAAIRSHRFEAGVMPGLFLSAADDAASIALFAGYAVRAFGSVEVLRIPRFSLHGPVLRVELRIPILPWLALRASPEGQLVLGISQELRALSGLPRTLLGFGGEVALEVRVHHGWVAALLYREAHLVAHGIESRTFTDAERYIVLELAYRIE